MKPEDFERWWKYFEGKKAAIGGVFVTVGYIGTLVYPPAAPAWTVLQVIGGALTGVGMIDKARRGEFKLPPKTNGGSNGTN